MNTENNTPTVLVVDDEMLNLEILTEYLEDAGYSVVSVEDGMKAWLMVEKNPHRFDAILLDRMMPRMSGMDVLARIKNHQQLCMLPVILQTAKAAKFEILEGLQAGACYYLTKPFDKNTMLAIVKTAVSDYQKYRRLQFDIEQSVHTFTLLSNGLFVFRTLDEGRDLATLLSNASPLAGKIVVGLAELLTNAVEHGNLGITYQEKSILNDEDRWQEEVEHRLTLPENLDKMVAVEFKRTDEELSFLIQDQGSGFDWESYLEVSPDRVFDNHGRGIAMARMLSFDHLEYSGNGNQVLAKVSLV